MKESTKDNIRFLIIVGIFLFAGAVDSLLLSVGQ